MLKTTRVTQERMSLFFGERYFIFLTFEEKEIWSHTGLVKTNGTLKAYLYPDLVFRSIQMLAEMEKNYIIGTTKENLLLRGFHAPKDISLDNEDPEFLIYDGEKEELDFNCTDMFCSLTDAYKTEAFRTKAKELEGKRKIELAKEDAELTEWR